jgi:hypothetical protein
MLPCRDNRTVYHNFIDDSNKYPSSTPRSNAFCFPQITVFQAQTENMAPKKQIPINFFETACTGSHMGIGQWKDPADKSRTKDSLEYYTWLAELADKGKSTSFFFANTYAFMNTYGGRGDGSFRGMR